MTNHQSIVEERTILFNRLQKLSESELQFDFGFGHRSIKNTLIETLKGYDNVSTSSLQTLTDLKNAFESLPTTETNHQALHNEYRNMGQLDCMLHLVNEQSKNELVAGRQKVTERINFKSTRL